MEIFICQDFAEDAEIQTQASSYPIRNSEISVVQLSLCALLAKTAKKFREQPRD